MNQIRTSLTATFAGNATSKELLTTFITMSPFIIAVVVYCLLNHVR